MSEGPAADSATIEYVGGPDAGRRESVATLEDDTTIGAWPPTFMDRGGGVYRRSARCADDGTWRYLWSARTRPSGS